jgi:hypothetical protein
MPLPHPPEVKAARRLREFDFGVLRLTHTMVAALASGSTVHGELAANDAADVLASWDTHHGWPFYVRTIRALDAAGLLS